MDSCRSLPVFPLPKVVLMPSSVLPLHVFEPRYRELVAHVRAGDGLMGIATLRPGYEANYSGSPPVFPEVGVGRIVEHEELAEDRCNIILVHVASARILEEVEVSHPFRVFHAEVSDGSDVGDAAVSAVRSLILQLATSAGAGAGSEAERLSLLSGMELVNAVARRMLQTAERQRAYLGLDNPGRVAFVCDALASLLSSTDSVGDA